MEFHVFLFFFFLNDPAPTEISPLPLHDALPISVHATASAAAFEAWLADAIERARRGLDIVDRKSTRLNSSHGYISYAVFCLKKKKQHSDSAPYDLNTHIFIPFVYNIQIPTHCTL